MSCTSQPSHPRVKRWIKGFRGRCLFCCPGIFGSMVESQPAIEENTVSNIALVRNPTRHFAPIRFKPECGTTWTDQSLLSLHRHCSAGFNTGSIHRPSPIKDVLISILLYSKLTGAGEFPCYLHSKGPLSSKLPLPVCSNLGASAHHFIYNFGLISSWQQNVGAIPFYKTN